MEGIPSVEDAQTLYLPRNPFAQHRLLKSILRNIEATSGQDIRVSKVTGFVHIGDYYRKAGDLSFNPLLNRDALVMVAQTAESIDRYQQANSERQI